MTLDRRQRLELSRWIRRTTFVTSGLANVVGALVVAVYFVALSPGDLPSGFRIGEVVALVALYLVLAIPIADWLSRRGPRGAQEALEQGEALSAEDRAKLVAIPWQAALFTLGFWVLGSLLFTAYYVLRYDDPTDEVASTGLTIVLGGLTTSALVFLLNEAPLRRAYELAFADAPPTRAEGLGVGIRLILAWGLGAGVPLLGIALAFVGTEQEDYDTLARAVLALVAIGLAAGCVITIRVARSVAGPLDQLRDAVDRLRQGDLSARVPIDDVTEIGLLQAGFNEMVAGLRERAELEDLFGRHVGADVAREALRRGVKLGCEQREASALFIDVVGSTSLAATRAPEDVVSLLNDLFGAVVRVVSEDGGWVNKFEGDGALCVCGAPVDDPDHAARALCAARRLGGELDRLADRHPGFDAGIGVSSGIVVAGNVGAEQRHEYTVIGDPVNEAARLTEEAKARPGRVLASGEAVRLAGEEAERWREAAALELRGRAEPTLAWEPVERVPGSLPSSAS